MITATGLELRAGARLLLGDATFRIAPGDRVGLVGRNGAGKTTLTRVLSGETQPAAGEVTRSGQRRLPAAGPAHRRPRRPRPRPDPVGPRPGRGRRADARHRGRDGQRRPGHPRARRCAATAGWRRSSRPPAATPPRARPRRSRPASGCRTGCSASRCAPCPAVSAAGSSWPGSCSRRPAPTHAAARRADQPPRRRLDRLAARLPQGATRAGWSSSATTSACSSTRVNRVFHLDANRAELDIYNVGWKAYLAQRETDERRRKRERANAEKQAVGAQGAGRPDALQGDQGARGAEHGQAGRQAARPASRRCAATTRSPSCASPTRRRAARRRSPPRGCRSPTARSRCSPTSTSPSTGAAGSSSSASTARARPPCCGCSPASRSRTPARSCPGHGLKLGYYAQEHETLDPERTVLENMRSAAPDLRRRRGTPGARLVPVHRRRRRQAGGGALRRREDPARAGHAGRVERQRADARRADQQPRPGQPRGDPRRAAHATPAPSSW